MANGEKDLKSNGQVRSCLEWEWRRMMVSWGGGACR